MQDSTDQGQHLTPALQELEDALRRLEPAAAGLDRDDVVFSAGAVFMQKRLRRRQRAWQAVAAAMAACLVVAVLHKPTTREVERIVYVPTVQAPAASVAKEVALWPDAPAVAADQFSYLRLRQQVLSKGLDALPSATYGGPSLPAVGLRSAQLEAELKLQNETSY